MAAIDLDIHVPVHHGIPHTASIMALDPVQSLLAVGTLDGRIKIFGGDNIEGLLISPQKLPYKFLEFFCNQGFIVGVSNGNEIQVWDLESRRMSCSLQWDSNITAFCVIQGTFFMYLGDDNGLLSVSKFDVQNGKILILPYYLPMNFAKEAAGVPFSGPIAIVGILQQPSTLGDRVLIAYEDGVMILWDISENCVVVVRGHTDFLLKEEGLSNVQSTSDCTLETKEICSLCWASSTGSLLAVGYIDGDILLWHIPSEIHENTKDTKQLSNNIVKLELSSGKRRLPVILLQFSTATTSNSDHGGKLFVYGGDEIGSDEVLTVLNLDWSAGLDKVNCISRMDILLCGSFANMILLPTPGGKENTPAAAMFVLTNPGQLNVYDAALFSDSTSHKTKTDVSPNKFPLAIPTADPFITVTKFCTLHILGGTHKGLSKKGYAKRTKNRNSFSVNIKSALTGGVPSELWFDQDGVDRLYMAGYQDGSVRIWDATRPTFSLLYVIFTKVNGFELKNENPPLSALEFSTMTLCLAVGNEYGLVFLYDLCMSDRSEKQDFHFIDGTKGEVHVIQQENEDFHCAAVFALSNSAVRAMKFSESGAKLAVGFQSGHVTVLDSSSMTVLFNVENLSVSTSPILSLAMRVTQHNANAPLKSSSSGSQALGDSADILYILTKNAQVIVADGTYGNILNSKPIHPQKDSTAISMHVIDGCNFFGAASENHSLKGLPGSGNTGRNNRSSLEASIISEAVSIDPVLLICCEYKLQVYQLKSEIKGVSFHIKEVILPKPCCWTALIKRKDEKETWALLLLYQNGVLEIRSFPEFKVQGEESLSSILRWSFNASMAKTASSCDHGEIALVNGSELAVISILAGSNDFRIPDSFPILHDKVLATAAEAAASQYITQMRKQDLAPGILGSILGLRRGKTADDTNASELGQSPRYSFMQRLENNFAKAPFSALPSASISDEKLELSIDDIIIDEELPTSSISPHVDQADWKEKKDDREREQLFQGGNLDVKPRLRTPEEIMTQYKFGGDATAAAAHAKDKLAQRQEKLQRTKERTEELQNEAENFASMAHELAKRMEAKKKWWKL